MLLGIQDIPQEHLHTFQLFIHPIKQQTSSHNNISLLGVYSCIIRWTLKTIHALLTITFGEYLDAFMQIVMPYWNFE